MLTFCLKHVFPHPTFRETVNTSNASCIWGMFEASLKFQATEKQADERQRAELGTEMLRLPLQGSQHCPEYWDTNTGRSG